MTIFSKLIILAEKYVPRAVFDGDIHLIKAIDSFQVQLKNHVFRNLIIAIT